MLHRLLHVFVTLRSLLDVDFVCLQVLLGPASGGVVG